MIAGLIGGIVILVIAALLLKIGGADLD